MLTRIRDDLRHAYASLHATVHALLTRGQSLESIQHQSALLADYAEQLRVAAEEARRQAELLNRSKRKKRMLAVTAALLLFLCSSFYLLS